MKKCCLFTLALIFLLAGVLYAHDTYVEKQGDGLVVVHGHGGKHEPYNPKFIKDAQAYDAAGKKMAVTIKPQATEVVLVPARPPALVEFVYDTGPRVKTPEGWKSMSKRQAKGGLQAIRFEKHVKQINQWNKLFGKPLGGKMEIVPLKNPLTLKVGDKLPFLVLYDGKPLAGVAVRAAGVGKDELKTDKNGKAAVGIKKTGLNVVGIYQKTPTPNDPDVDTLGEIATLNFKVK
jgi:nickel transport protein